MKNVSNTIEKDCCGCGACMQICPKKCISLVENDRGFLIPKVDEKECISCGLCKKVCPESCKEMSLNTVIDAYAAVTKNLEQHKKSTSGGIFYILAEEILNNNGVVFGAAWKNERTVAHMMVDEINDLCKLCQSKYVQSNTEKTFIETKKMLNEGKKVLYSGTACQIAALRTFLIDDYENLITVEVACHGVPSPGLFEKYLKWREKENNHKIIEFRFRHRDKHPSGEHYMASAKFDNGKIKYYSIEKDPYYNAFLNGNSLRETCYKCKYKNKKRVADITLSDFWGIEKEIKDFPAYYGCSAVLVNTKKGQNLFNKINNNIVFESCDKEAVYAHNKSMIESSKRRKEKIYKSINVNDMEFFRDIMEEYTLKRKLKMSLKHYIPSKILYRLRRMWRNKK